MLVFGRELDLLVANCLAELVTGLAHLVEQSLVLGSELFLLAQNGLNLRHVLLLLRCHACNFATHGRGLFAEPLYEGVSSGHCLFKGLNASFVVPVLDCEAIGFIPCKVSLRDGSVSLPSHLHSFLLGNCQLFALLFFDLSQLLFESQLLHPELLGQRLLLLLLQLVKLLHLHDLLAYMGLVI